jgi:hypothetical protein
MRETAHLSPGNRSIHIREIVSGDKHGAVLMNPETQSNQSYLERLSEPVTQRWPIFPNQDISLRVVVYKDGSEAILAENGAAYSTQLTDHGFTSIDGEWMLPEVKLAPRALMKSFPGMQINKLPVADILLDRTSVERPAALLTAAAPNPSFADRASMETMYRWPSFPDQDISLFVAVYKDNSDAVVAKGGNRYSEQLGKLGFTQVDGEWMLPTVKLAPREIMKLFPGMKIENQRASDIFLDRTATERPNFPVQPAQNHSSWIGSKIKERLAAAADAKQGQSQTPKL